MKLQHLTYVDVVYVILPVVPPPIYLISATYLVTSWRYYTSSWGGGGGGHIVLCNILNVTALPVLERNLHTVPLSGVI